MQYTSPTQSTRIKRVLACFALAAGLVISSCSAGCKKSLGPQPPVSKYYDFISNFNDAYILGRANFIDVGSSNATRYLDEGWHEGETTKNGFTYAYSDGYRSAFHFEVIRPGDYKMAFRAKALPYPGAPPQKMTVKVNDRQVGVIELGPEFSIPVVNVPSTAVAPGKNRVVLDFSWAKRPEDVLGSKDERLISAMFDYIMIFRNRGELETLLKKGGPLLKMVGTGPGTSEQLAIVFPTSSVVRYSDTQLVNGTKMKFTWGLIGPPPKSGMSFRVKWLGESGKKRILFERKISGEAKAGLNQSAEIALGFLGRSHGSIDFSVDFDNGEPSSSVVFVTSAGLFARLPNVVLIAADALRADRLSCYGGPVHTPNLDRLAREGILFENAYSQYPATPPSFASIFTGRLPIHHGVRSLAGVLPFNEETMTQILEPLFPARAGFTSLLILQKAMGLSRGFDTYLSPLKTACWKWTAQQVNESAIPWIKEHSNENFFLFLHYADPHYPYAAPGSLDVRLTVSLDGKVVYDDHLTYSECVEFPAYLTPGKHRMVLKAEYSDECIRGLEGLFKRKLKSENFRIICQLGKEGGVSIESGPEGFSSSKVLSEFSVPFEKPVEVAISLNESKPATKMFEFMPCLIGGSGNSCPGANYEGAYNQEVAYLDKQIGLLMSTLRENGILNKTVLIFTADHGEEFMEHGFMGHVQGLYGQSLHVPLIWRAPWIFKGGERVKSRVRLIDIAPTLMGILGLPPRDGMDGVNLLPLIRKQPFDLPAIAETLPEGEKHRSFSIMRGDWHLILYQGNKPPELFNVRKDPQEQENVARDNMAVVNRMASELKTIISKSSLYGGERVITPEIKSTLRAMGYIK